MTFKRKYKEGHFSATGIAKNICGVISFHHRFQGLQALQIFIFFIDSFVNKEKKMRDYFKIGLRNKFNDQKL